MFGPSFRTLAGVLVSDSRVWILYGCFESISILCSKPFSLAAFFPLRIGVSHGVAIFIGSLFTRYIDNAHTAMTCGEERDYLEMLKLTQPPHIVFGSDRGVMREHRLV